MEKMLIYEKIVPEMIPCTITFSVASRIICQMFIESKAIRIGKFASPMRKKGIGFGIAHSSVERNIQRAVKKASFFL